ncbi:MAG TPA: hypothetical protein PL196_03505 [Burkholderiaceae bacterium]|nr:hypothetical protein [Burkholderiaceae bacterium]
MNHVRPCLLPPGALLVRQGDPQGYADCFVAEVGFAVTLPQFVEAFYRGGVFRVERVLLALALRSPSTDAQAGALARGEIDTFAIWRVEERTGDQMLLRASVGRTRSWFMVAPAAEGAGTRLYFGSSVAPERGSEPGSAPRMGWAFRALLGFHKAYSRVLLGSARERLARTIRPGAPS